MNSSRLRRACASLLVVVGTVAAAAPGPGFVPPVDAPVADGFRAPTTPFGPGNRGIEYDTEPGDPVLASAAGEVVFAGEVAGSLHVTLLHDDGIRTSYSFLQGVEVVVGARLAQGDRLGAAGQILHFGARHGDDYFDPATLFGTAGGLPEVELLPFEVPPGAQPDAERAALVQLAFDNAGGGMGLPGWDAAAEWFVERARLIEHYVTDLDLHSRSFASAWDLATRLSDPPVCSDGPSPHRPVADQARAAMLVGGLGSSVESASINHLRVEDLGYEAAAVERLAYESEGDLLAAGRELAARIEALAAARPEATLDLYGHSMGGVVVRLGLVELERRGFDLARLGLVTTFGSPHQGASLATAAVSGGIWTDAPAVAQLAETSPVIDQLEHDGVPAGVRLLSLAASGDVVVAAPDTVVPGAANVTVDLFGYDAHGDLVTSDEATGEVARALAGVAPSCEDPWDVVHESVTGEAVSYVEDLTGFALVPSGG